MQAVGIEVKSSQMISIYVPPVKAGRGVKASTPFFVSNVKDYDGSVLLFPKRNINLNKRRTRHRSAGTTLPSVSRSCKFSQR